MKILIVGAGRIGSSVAESLVSEANDITVVDQDAERIGSLQSRFDLRGVVGNATSPQVLTDAGAADTDMLIAVTSSDETNLVVNDALRPHLQHSDPHRPRPQQRASRLSPHFGRGRL